MAVVSWLCSYIGADGEECEDHAMFVLRFRANRTNMNLEACDAHLAAVARGIPELYAADTVTLVELDVAKAWPEVRR